MSDKVLCVDDELNVLLGFQRHWRKRFEMEVALGPERALQMIAEKGPYAVVVSDLNMPGMSGIQFLTRVRMLAPKTVRIMLTGHADLAATISAVNEGNIFQFLTKPCPPEMFARAIEAAIDQNHLLSAERDLMERTLNGSIAVMTELLSMVNPIAFSRAQRIRRYVSHMTSELRLPDRWRYELAAMLSQIGCVMVPQQVMAKAHAGTTLSPEELAVLASHCAVGRDLLARIPRLESVAEMVGMQRASWADTTKSGCAAIGGNLLRIALDFDEAVERGDEVDSILGRMLVSRHYNYEFVNVLQRVQVARSTSKLYLLKVAELERGMMIDCDVFATNGVLLIARGQRVTDAMLACLQSFVRTLGVVEPIRVAAVDPYPAEP
jgi:FixJ family two-component response regulator